MRQIDERNVAAILVAIEKGGAPSVDQQIGTAIRTSREAAGITLRALAEGLGVSAPFLSDVEHGRRNAVRWLPKIAEIVRSPALLRLADLLADACPHCHGTGKRAGSK